MKKLKFYDLKNRKAFWSDKYKLVKKKKTHFAVTKAPSGTESWRIVSKDFAKGCKK